MAELKKIGVSIQTVATITLNDSELAALDALVGYGADEFLKVFYRDLGEAYLRPHEAGLRSFFKACSGAEGMTKAASECREFLDQIAKRQS